MKGGGAERIAGLLCDAWSEKGHQVTLMQTFSGREDAAFSVDESVTLVALADLVSGTKGRLTRLVALRRYIVESSPDIIVSFLPEVNVAALLAARGTGISLIVSERNYPAFDAVEANVLLRVLRRWTYRWARAVVVQTDAIADWVAGNCRGSTPVVIPNPVSLPLVGTEPSTDPAEIIDPTRKLILGVGRLQGQKRFDRLIRSFAAISLENPDWNLVILGEGPELATLKKLANDLGVSDSVDFPEFVGNMADWYERANIYVLSSAFEGFPNTLLEAMAHGVASVAFDIKTGPREIMAEGALGMLLPDDDHEARLTEVLTDLCQDGDKRQALGQSGLQVRETYALAPILRAWDDVLQDRH